jgi:ribosomal-protein-alanine N-acetyltransferase
VPPDTVQPTLETARLILRPFVGSDAADVQRLAGAREIADTTLAIPHPYPLSAAEQWIESHPAGWDAGTGVAFAITLQSTGELMGAVGLVKSGRHASGELGYWIAVPHWNRGYCTEAASALVSFGFGALDLHRIHAHHLSRNPSSGRVMQKIGMIWEGRMRQAIRKWDHFEDVEMYAILATDLPPESVRP